MPAVISEMMTEQKTHPYRSAHMHSANHRDEILASAFCGCFYCRSTFAPEAIKEWCDEDDEGVGRTAICPRCGVDSVVGSASGLDLTDEFLSAMHEAYF